MRRNVRRQNIGVALFPFLAVLICTMGSLIVLLMLFVSQARVHAKGLAEQAAASMASASREVSEKVEDAHWRRELLEQQRQEKAEQLAESRAKLAHLEDHLQRLQQQAKELIARAQNIDQGKKLKDDQQAAAREELRQLQQRIAEKKAELDDARTRQRGQQQSYTLIPYDGPNGTRRRPIYIECTQHGIVIQPEGLVFRAEDFNGPMGPGNPLDAALRSIREYRTQVSTGPATEPYPLLVVRPSGVLAYSAARSALKSWDDEFGYELISDDKHLDFGESDPALAEALQKAVTTARQRQSALAASMPGRYRDDEPITSFDPTTSPGLAPEAFTPGRGVGVGAGGAGTGYSERWSDGRAPRSAAGSANPQEAGQQANAGSPPSPTGPYGAVTRDGASSPASSQTAAAPSDPNQPKQQHGGDSRQEGRAGGVAGAKYGQGPVPTGKSTGSANWGIPGAAGRTVGITRPMYVAVLADRLVLVPGQGEDRPPVHVRIQQPMNTQHVDAFVAAVQNEMKNWGIAVAGGYWKPLLQVEVAPDAEHHFADLQIALEGSGYEIQRKR